MNRRAQRARLPWGGGSSTGGLYGGSNSPLARLGILGLIVLGLAAIAFFLYTRACAAPRCDREYCESSRSVAAPEGYALVSKVFEFNTNKGPIPAGRDISVQVPLEKATQDGRNLSFYRYVEDSKAWEPVAPATLDPQGNQVSGVLKDAPPLMAVMRRLSEVGSVVAYLDHNRALHPEAIPHVTIVHTLDFKPVSDGTVAGDLSTIKLDARVAHYPVLSASAADKGNILVEAILANATSRSNHVQQILKKVNDTKVSGIDIAYLDLRADQRGSFTLLISELGDALHKQGKTLTLTLPTPLKVQDRVDEGAYDWAELGKSADLLQLAPFRDQSTYRKDMPEILQSLEAKVSPNKLILTVTPYATEKADEGLRRLSLTQAMSIATKLGVRSSTKIETSSIIEVVANNIDKSENLSGITWDPNTACVAFTYKNNGNRVVWIENFFSVGFKLDLIPRFGLGGVAIEDASDDTYLGNIWTALVPFITSGQPVLMQPNGTDLIPKFTPEKGSIEGGPLAPRGSVKWVTPAEPGTYRVTLQLSDGVALFESEIAVNVQQRDAKTPGPGGTAQPGQTPVG